MARDYARELEKRVAFIKELLASSGARGIVYGNSGGKDCTLVGILCKKACDNTVGVIMPCASKRNYESDTQDALAAGAQYGIEQRTVDVTQTREALMEALSGAASLNDDAVKNLAPRLRMTTLYAIGAAEGRLVAGTGNRSETYLGYFTKWGDGACDFNPIRDLTVTEVYEFLDYLEAPVSIRTKAPSAGLFEGQTDEQEMGVSYAAVDQWLFTGTANDKDRATIERMHARSEHKRKGIAVYND